MATQHEIDALSEAVWQVLDDMGFGHSKSCCLAAKAALRIAYEPFKMDDEDVDSFMPLGEAKSIISECEG